jgi:primary-amine oxidase
MAGKVIHIDYPPHYKRSDKGIPVLTNSSTKPPLLSDDALAASNRERIPPPMKSFDFLPDLLANDPEHKPREDVRPLHVVQPEGVSFKMNGHELEWQKWKMHIGTYVDFSTVRTLQG